MKGVLLSLITCLFAAAGGHAQSPPATPPAVVKSAVKPGGPPAVSVHAKSIATGKLSVTFTYFSNHNSKIEQLTCSGSLPDIEKQVRAPATRNSMPAPVQDLVEAALQRLRQRQVPPLLPPAASKAP